MLVYEKNLVGHEKSELDVTLVFLTDIYRPSLRVLAKMNYEILSYPVEGEIFVNTNNMNEIILNILWSLLRTLSLIFLSSIQFKSR